MQRNYLFQSSIDERMNQSLLMAYLSKINLIKIVYFYFKFVFCILSVESDYVLLIVKNIWKIAA